MVPLSGFRDSNDSTQLLSGCQDSVARNGGLTSHLPAACRLGAALSLQRPPEVTTMWPSRDSCSLPQDEQASLSPQRPTPLLIRSGPPRLIFMDLKSSPLGVLLHLNAVFTFAVSRHTIPSPPPCLWAGRARTLAQTGGESSLGPRWVLL